MNSFLLEAFLCVLMINVLALHNFFLGPHYEDLYTFYIILQPLLIILQPLLNVTQVETKLRNLHKLFSGGQQPNSNGTAHSAI